MAIEKRRREKERKRRDDVGRWGRRHKRIASHATELNPPLKFTLLRRSLTCARLPEGTLQNALLDRRRDIATNESISESGLGSQNLFDIIERIVKYDVNC